MAAAPATAADELVVFVKARDGRRLRLALGGLEDRELRLRDVLAVVVDPGQCVVVLAGAQIDEHAAGPASVERAWLE